MSAKKMRTQEKYPVDKEKLLDELKERGLNQSRASVEMGYDASYISCRMYENALAKPVLLMMEKMFGITYDMIKPDDQMKKEKREEKSTNPELVAAAGTSLDLDKITDLLKDTKELIKENAEYCQMIKQGFRVQTSPRFSTQDISAGVREGIAMWWSQNKSDVMSKLRGTMYAAFFEALHAEDKKGGQK